MELIIRRAKSSDNEPIRNLFRDTVLSINSKDYNREEIEVWADHSKNIESWLKKINEQYFIVADLNNIIVGFSSITDKGYLDFMYVHADYQRQGIAQKLLTEIERRADQLFLKEIYSHVSTTAQGFFERNGYTITGTHINKVGEIKFVNAVMVKAKTQKAF